METFTGKLSKIAPSKLIDQRNDDQMDSFFLVLGLIYNDLKGLVLFYNLFLEKYEVPDKEVEPNCHSGEYEGVKKQLDRLVIAFLSEMFIFLEKSHDVLHTAKFQVLVNKSLDSDQKKQWDSIIGYLKKDQGKSTRSFLSKIAEIRSNVAYHYDHSLSELKKSFRKFFFSGAGNSFQEKAYYSMGESMRDTRFYYADAAVQQYLQDKLGAGDDEFQKIPKIVEDINQVFSCLLRVYLKLKSK